MRLVQLCRVPELSELSKLHQYPHQGIAARGLPTNNYALPRALRDFISEQDPEQSARPSEEQVRLLPDVLQRPMKKLIAHIAQEPDAVSNKTQKNRLCRLFYYLDPRFVQASHEVVKGVIAIHYPAADLFSQEAGFDI